jgi:hypothetical protein
MTGRKIKMPAKKGTIDVEELRNYMKNRNFIKNCFGVKSLIDTIGDSEILRFYLTIPEDIKKDDVKNKNLEKIVIYEACHKYEVDFVECAVDKSYSTAVAELKSFINVLSLKLGKRRVRSDYATSFVPTHSSYITYSYHPNDDDIKITNTLEIKDIRYMALDEIEKRNKRYVNQNITATIKLEDKQYLHYKAKKIITVSFLRKKPGKESDNPAELFSTSIKNLESKLYVCEEGHNKAWYLLEGIPNELVERRIKQA